MSLWQHIRDFFSPEPSQSARAVKEQIETLKPSTESLLRTIERAERYDPVKVLSDARSKKR